MDSTSWQPISSNDGSETAQLLIEVLPCVLTPQRFFVVY